jgi:type VI secretion system protein ImpM
MRCGLFGKLPAKRDFIAIGAPRDFLRVWEPWVQGGVSASRQALGDNWQRAYLTAPIWRFWLGADLAGTTIAGAFMPSMDGIGRYFPLTLFASADDGADIAPPEFDAQDGWYEPVEDFLLATLDRDATYEAIAAGLERLPPPANSAGAPRPPDTAALDRGLVVKAEGNPSFPTIFGSMRVADPVNAYAGSSFWWTVGGQDYAPLAIALRAMPAPFLFTEMLTGRFAFGF